MDILKFFENSIDQNKVSHLYLIVGPQGERRDQLLLSIIQQLNHHSFETKLAAQESSQLYWIEAENTMIKKQQIVALQEEFSKTSLSEGKRIYVIDDIETMNVQSSNALLKFLEEPLSNKTIGLLTTDKPQSILDTILSRAQLLKMPYLNKEDVVDHLTTLEIPDSKKSIIAEITRDLSVAESLCEYQEIDELVQFIETFPKQVHSKDVFEQWLLEKTKVFSENGSFFEYLVKILYRLLLDIKKEQLMTFSVIETSIEDIMQHINTDVLDDILYMLQQTLYENRYNIHLDTSRRKMIHSMKRLIKS
ncbi:MAG: hypothetical protein ACO3MF_00800 [Acholeplasmataceae bacterium]